MNRRTKIVATLGPATDTPDQLEKMLHAGVDLVRVNFSHGTIEMHRQRIDAVRACADQMGRHIGILVDLQGPKIRIAKFAEGSAILEPGMCFTIDTELAPTAGTQTQVGTEYPHLARDVYTQDILLLDDGRVVLQVKNVTGSRIETEVLVGGRLSDNKGINLKGGGLSAGAITSKDRQDIKYAAQLGADYVAISFPGSANDIKEARILLEEARSAAGIIAKIERAEAVEKIEEIIQAADGVMVARGDLAVEIGDAEVPAIQKMIIRRAWENNKPVITATQMMESMINSTIPTRAEVSDVANAILDGTDAVMLSAETAVGEHPANVVSAVHRVCLAVERQPVMRKSRHRIDYCFDRVDEVIAMAAMYTANHMRIKAIAAISASGTTPLWMSRIRTGIPIYGLSNQASALGKMTLFRNVYPIALAFGEAESNTIQAHAIAELERRNLVHSDDHVILTKGDCPGVHGGTNGMNIVQVARKTTNSEQTMRQ
jgi:pyruvate kinase